MDIGVNKVGCNPAIGGIWEVICPLAEVWDGFWSDPLWFGFTIALGGAIIAYQRSLIANKQSKYERFHEASKLLGARGTTTHTGRFAGVETLWKLAQDDPKEFHVEVMGVFAAFLSFPPYYSGGDKCGTVDFESSDTVQIIELVNHHRSPKQRKVEYRRNYEFDLREGCVFCVRNGLIEQSGERGPEWKRTTLDQQQSGEAE